MRAPVLGLTLLLAATLPAAADTLLMDAVNAAPPNGAAGVPRPHNGMTMDAVRARYGEPASTRPAVGEPPITRWVYPTHTVYFEYDRVIESVVHR